MFKGLPFLPGIMAKLLAFLSLEFVPTKLRFNDDQKRACVPNHLVIIHNFTEILDHDLCVTHHLWQEVLKQ